MSKATVTRSLVLNGHSYSVSSDITGDGNFQRDPDIGPALAGTLTTRTDNDTGVVTVGAGHGLVTADKVDVYFDGGQRRQMAVSVAGNLITIDGGSGGNLPLLNAPVTLMKEHPEPFSVIGNNVKALAAECKTARGFVTFRDGAGAEIAFFDLTSVDTATWDNLNGVANPLAGATVSTVCFTQSDATNARKMYASVLLA